MTYTISLDQRVSLTEVHRVTNSAEAVAINEGVRRRVRASSATLEKTAADDRAIHGAGTSPGGFANWLVPASQARRLREALLNAMAANADEHLDDATVRAIMLSRIISLARGNSAISLQNLETLIAILNSGIVPCVPEQGSLGNDEDLGPLAAIALVCVGQWRARIDGRAKSAAEALRQAKIEPMALSFREGMALINGTSGMVGVGSLTTERALRLLLAYLAVSALSIEALRGTTEQFDARAILDPVLDSLGTVRRTVEDELNSSGDNGQYVSTAMDHLAIALITTMNLSNWRIEPAPRRQGRRRAGRVPGP